MNDTDEPESELPDEKIVDLLARLSKRFEKIGLEMTHAVTSEDPTPDDALDFGEEREHRLVTIFKVTPLAFSDRVLDPEQEKVDDEIRVMEHDAVDEAAERIRREARESWERQQKKAS